MDLQGKRKPDACAALRSRVIRQRYTSIHDIEY
jgi:hypothetical protein